ncbi:MAG: hypothetical protein LC739_07480 [Actinobacteria bacterium]|nr:hypothetical protein [Actinomycetota bacterium]
MIPRGGRFLAQAYRRDPETGKVTRPSVGTYSTHDEALRALARDFGRGVNGQTAHDASRNRTHWARL